MTRETDNNQKKTIQAFRCVLPFVQLVIGELVIIFFIGHWNLVIGYCILHRLLSFFFTGYQDLKSFENA